MGEKLLCGSERHKDAVLAADGMLLCDGCIVGLRRDLEELPGLYRDLLDEAVSGTGPSVEGPGFVTGTPQGKIYPAMKYNSGASDAADQIQHDVIWWVKKMVSERTRENWSGNAEAGMRWLLREVYWIAGSGEYAVVVRDVSRGLVNRAIAVLDPRGRPVEVGGCVEKIGGLECTGSVRKYGEGKDSRLVCDTCGHRVPIRSWGRYGERVRNRRVEDLKGL